MDQLRLVSILLSLCLHAAIFASALFWPSGPVPMINLNASVIEVTQYTIGAPGTRSSTPAPVDKPAVPAAKPATPDAPAAKPEPPQTPPAQPQKMPDKPAAKPEPPKVPEAKPISDSKKETPPKQTNATKTAAAAPPKKPAEKSEDVLKKALSDLGGAQPQSKAQGKSGPDPGSVAQALGAFKKAGAGDGETGEGPGGSGGDGVGILGTYQQSLVSRIRPQWEYAGRADRKNPRAIARINIAKDGTILGATIEKSSGDAAFDGSVLKAIRDTEKVEPPPTPQLMDISLGFAYEALAGGQ